MGLARLQESLEGDADASPATPLTKAGALLGTLRSNALYHRPDDYWEKIAERYRGMTISTLDQAARRVIDPSKLVWVVVGDAATVRPQLAELGIPVEVVKPQ